MPDEGRAPHAGPAQDRGDDVPATDHAGARSSVADRAGRRRGDDGDRGRHAPPGTAHRRQPPHASCARSVRRGTGQPIRRSSSSRSSWSSAARRHAPSTSTSRPDPGRMGDGVVDDLTRVDGPTDARGPAAPLELDRVRVRRLDRDEVVAERHAVGVREHHHPVLGRPTVDAVQQLARTVVSRASTTASQRVRAGVPGAGAPARVGGELTEQLGRSGRARRTPSRAARGRGRRCPGRGSPRRVGGPPVGRRRFRVARVVVADRPDRDRTDVVVRCVDLRRAAGSARRHGANGAHRGQERDTDGRGPECAWVSDACPQTAPSEGSETT